jgi:hypothetical protein
LEVHHACRDFGLNSDGNRKGLAKAIVESFGDHAGDLKMLALVIAHGNLARLVEQYVARHENGIGQESYSVTFLALRLLFELSHPTEFAVRGNALEQPIELCVVGHLTLQKHGADVGIEAAGEKCCEQLGRLVA